jgi:hypothetical protein
VAREKSVRRGTGADTGGGCMGYMGDMDYPEIFKRFIACYGGSYREDELLRIHRKWKSITKMVMKGRL